MLCACLECVIVPSMVRAAVWQPDLSEVSGLLRAHHEQNSLKTDDGTMLHCKGHYYFPIVHDLFLFYRKVGDFSYDFAGPKPPPIIRSDKTKECTSQNSPVDQHYDH